MEDLLPRLLAKVKFCESGCWEWVGAINSKGYGNIGTTRGGVGRTYQAHRLSYMLHIGPIPRGICLDHVCQNKRCINPEHLEPVTRRDNTRRAFAHITHCPNGHSYSDHGVVKRSRTGHSMYCKECNRIRAAFYRA